MRNGKLDFFKGLLIWSVVLGHCINVLGIEGNWLHLILRLFDLPLFMYISGYLMRGSIARYDYKQLIVNKVTNIAFPAFVWILISLLFGDLHSYYFLWAVFISSVIVCLCETIVRKIFTQSHVGGTFLIMFAIIFHLVPKNIVNISFLYPFFIFGYFTENICIVGWKKGLISCVVFISLLLCVWQPEYTIWNTGGFILQNTGFITKVVSLRLVLGMTGIFSAVFVMGKVYDFANNMAPVELLSNFGKQTLAIYMMQHIVVEIFLFRLMRLVDVGDYLKDYSVLIGYFVSPLISLVLLYVMYKIAILLCNYKYTKWVFGVKTNLQSIR